MRLMYLDQAGIDDLKINFSSYKSHFIDPLEEIMTRYKLEKRLYRVCVRKR